MIEKLLAALNTLGVPVARLFYDGEADAFVTFQPVYAGEDAFSDDDGRAVEHTVGVDVYAREDYAELLRRTRQALKDAGFYGITAAAEVFEDDTKYYHRPLMAYYTEFCEEEL